MSVKEVGLSVKDRFEQALDRYPLFQGEQTQEAKEGISP
jgi:hypothetical protein